MSGLIYEICRKWAKKSGGGDGIIVGADLTQEWLLPWWWEKYRRFNSYPVTFVDFGMSLELKTWCKKRGGYFRLPVADIFVVEKEEIESKRINEWEKINGKTFWPCRNAWFKKPLACLQSPYNRSIWIDLDCEIRGPISPLFEYCEQPSGLAMAIEIPEFEPSCPPYNSGIIVFKHGIPLFERWAADALDRNHLFSGDQTALCQRIFEERVQIAEIPPIYNWSRSRSENSGTIIQHWHGSHGKAVIAHQIWKERQ